VFIGSISTSNSNSQENFYRNNFAKDKIYDLNNRITRDFNDENYRDNNKFNDCKRLYSDINELYHKEKLRKIKKNNLQEIKTDNDLLFNYRNKELNTYNNYCVSNKKDNIMMLDYDLENNFTKNINSEISNYNNANNREIDNYNLKKIKRGMIKRENDTVMKQYEIYKNSDFEEYEKKYLLEKLENRSENKEGELNKIPLSSDNVRNSSINFNKIKEKIEIKSYLVDQFVIENKANSAKNINDRQLDKQNDINLYDKNEKKITTSREFIINFEDSKIREEKYNNLKQKLEKIKNHQKEFEKKLIAKELKIEDIKLNNSQQEKKAIKNKNIKIRSFSSKVSSNKQTIKKQTIINQNSNSKNKNSLKISVEKEFQNLKNDQDKEAKGTPAENKNFQIDPNSKNIIKLNNNDNILSNKNNSKENFSKEFKQVLNSLKIDNILQKTKLIFNRQLTINSNLTSSKVKNKKDFESKNIKITSNIVVADEKEKNNIRKSFEKFNKTSKTDNILNDLINPQIKKKFKDNYNKNLNNNKNNNNNQTSTIIINNNININTYIDKGEIIYSDDADRFQNKIKSKEKNMNILNKYNFSESEENNKVNFFKFSNENDSYKFQKTSNSRKYYEKTIEINNEKQLKSNLNFEKKESSTSKNIPTSTNDLKRGYSDNNYKNLLLCSYESGIKNSEFKLENRDKLSNKEYERIKDNLKINEFVDKYANEKANIIIDDYTYNFNKNRNNRNNFENFNNKDANITPSYLFKNHNRFNRPYSHIRSIDFDNRKTGVEDYLFYNEKEKSKPDFNFFNKYDNSLRLNNFKY
jgi:hypothetical protein